MSARIIHKVELFDIRRPLDDITLVLSSSFRKVWIGRQRDKVVMWYSVLADDDGKTQRELRFRVLGTGQRYDGHAVIHHVATIVCDDIGYVWHVYFAGKEDKDG
jgi:hypothetical protein